MVVTPVAGSPASASEVVVQRRVVVTGLGAISPVGIGVPATWEALLAGKSGAGPITQFDPVGHRTRIACEVTDFVAGDHQIGRAHV